MPFEALEAQGEMLGEMYDAMERTQKPTLSDDQYALMQYTMEEAIATQASIAVEYFHAGKRRHIQSHSLNIDAHARVLILSHGAIPLDDILDIVLL